MKTKTHWNKPVHTLNQLQLVSINRKHKTVSTNRRITERFVQKPINIVSKTIESVEHIFTMLNTRFLEIVDSRSHNTEAVEFRITRKYQTCSHYNDL